MCIVRNFKKKKFEMYQNEKKVLAYGECRTKDKAMIHDDGLEVSNAECVADEWIYS